MVLTRPKEQLSASGPRLIGQSLTLSLLTFVALVLSLC